MAAASSAEECLRAGDPAQALGLLQEQVRGKPGDAKLRTFLFQLLAVLGHWDRALAQLDVVGQLDAGALAMVAMYRDAIRCEVLRKKVFSGQTSPLLFGEPEQWLALLIESLLLSGRGQEKESAALRAQAFDGCARIAGGCRRPAVRMDRRCRLAPRASPRGGDQRPLLLGAVRATGSRGDRSAYRLARHGLAAGPSRVLEWWGDHGA